MMTKQSSGDTTLTLPSDTEILITRTFDAPRDLVFKAFTDPVLLPNWWGPRGYETLVDKLDVRPGGVWRFVQLAPDGSEHPFNGVFKEVVPPERLVFTFEYEPYPGHIHTETVLLEERDGKTHLTDRLLFENVEDRDGMIKAGMESGMRDSMDRLSEVVLQGPRDLVITRTFDAPLEMVWKAWTDPEQVMRWWGPKDYTSPMCKIDLREGGQYLFAMRAPDWQGGMEHYTSGIYQKIVPMEVLEFTQIISDKDGNPIDPTQMGIPPGVPEVVRTVVTFESKGDQTEITVSEYNWTGGQMYWYSLRGMSESLDKLAESLMNQ